MGYDISVADVDALGFWVGAWQGSATDALGSVADAAAGMASLGSLTGGSADAIKAYWGDAHSFVASCCSQAAAEAAARFALYADGYASGDLDGSSSARFDQDALERAADDLSGARRGISERADGLSSALSGVSDIVWVNCPDASGVDAGMASSSSVASALEAAVSAREEAGRQSAAGLDAIAQALEAVVAKMGSACVGGTSYDEASFASSDEVGSLYRAAMASSAWLEGNGEAAVSALWELSGREQERYEAAVAAAAAERERRGREEVFLGLLGAAAGVACIVLTCGAATPLVVTAAAAALGTTAEVASAGFVVAGAASAAYGLSNAYEGAQDWRYGAAGDATTPSVNVGRASFQALLGKESGAGAYDLVGVTATAVSALPVAEFAVERATSGGLPEGYEGYNGKIETLRLPAEDRDTFAAEKPTDRGFIVDEANGNNLGRSFPTYDYTDGAGRFVSTKSVDLTCKSYQTEGGLKSRLFNYIKDAAGRNFSGGTDLDGQWIDPSDVTSRGLDVVVPNVDITPEQARALNDAYIEAQRLHVDMTVKIAR